MKVSNAQGLVVFVALLLAAIKMGIGLESSLDIALFDETLYLDSGLSLASRGMPPADQAPLYAIWYWFLSFFATDPLALYYLNARLCFVFLALSSYSCLLSLSQSRLMSYILTIGILLSAIPYFEPRVNSFATCIVLCFFALAFKQSKRSWFYLLSALGFLLASYVRAEYYFGFLLVVVFFAINFFRDRLSGTRAFFVLVVTCTVLHLTFGNPFWRSSEGKESSRALTAFSHHFSARVLQDHTELDPWVQKEGVMKKAFGKKPESLGEAFVLNPKLVLEHIEQNALGLPKGVLANLLPDFHRQLSPYWNSLIRKCALLLIAFVFVLLVRKRFPQIHWKSREWTRFYQFLVAAAAPGILSALIIQPYPRYVLLLSLLVLMALALMLRGWQLKSTQHFYVFVVLSLIVLPSHSGKLSILSAKEPHHLPVRSVLREMMNLPKQEYRVLEVGGGYSVYLGNTFTTPLGKDEVYAALSDGALVDRIQDEQINLIVLDESLEKIFEADQELSRILKTQSVIRELE